MMYYFWINMSEHKVNEVCLWATLNLNTSWRWVVSLGHCISRKEPLVPTK